MEKSKKPKIRFKGYTDDWEQRKLGDLGSLKNGMNFSKDAMGHGSAFVNLQNIFGNNVVDAKSLDLAEASEKQLLDYSLQKGDVLFVRSSVKLEGVGETALVAENLENTTYSGFIIRFRDEYGLNNDFKKFVFSTKKCRDQIMSQATNSANKNISQSVLENLALKIPSKDEQKLIGYYFSTLEHLITLHQRKLDKLINVKKSMLEKMFPKQGSTVPEIRFTGFTNDWEQRELLELIIEYKETVEADCDLPILTSSKTEGVLLQEEHFGHKQNHDITGYNVLPRNYCTYRNRSDGIDFTFNINKCCDKGIISKFYPVFCGKENDTFFISLVLNNSDEVVREIGYTCTGTGQKVLAFVDLLKMNLKVPSHEEQKIIASYFEGLNHLITLHQCELEKLQNIKKSMLEKMFV